MARRPDIGVGTTSGKHPTVPLPKPPGSTDEITPPPESIETATADPIAMLAEVKQWHRESRDHSAPWRKEAEEMFGLVAGDQWKAEDAQILKEQGRPVITFNRIGPVIDGVAGLEVGNRQEVQYVPRQIGEAKANEIFTNAAKWVRDECGAEDEESDAFVDLLVSGMAATETRPDYEEDPEGLIEIDRIDPIELFWDPSAKKRNLLDRRYHLRARTMATEDAKAMFPHITDTADLDASWARQTNADLNPHDATRAPFYETDQSGRNDKGRERKLSTIVFAEWWVREAYWRVVSPQTDKKYDLTEEQHTAVMAHAKEAGLELKSARLTRKRYMQGYFGGKTLEIKPGRCPHGFSIQFMTGKRDRNKNLWYGLVRPMKDPQQWANKFFSQILFIINSNAKGGIIIEKDAVSDIRKFEESWADAGGVTVVQPNAIKNGKIQPKAAITFPNGLPELMQYAIQAIRDVTGVNLELMGMADRDQPGILEAQRKQAGMTILATMFDALRKYRKAQGKVMLYEIQEYLAPGRLIRITGEADTAQYMPLLKDPETIEYDVIVDSAPSSANEKDKVWAMLMQLAPALVKLGLPPKVWAEFIKYSPLPTVLSMAIAQAMEQPQGHAPDPEKIAAAEAKTAQAGLYRAQTVEALASAGVAANQPSMDAAQMMADLISQHAQQGHEANLAQGQAGVDAQGQLMGHIKDLLAQRAQQSHEQTLAAMPPPVNPNAQPPAANGA